ncbi:MAG: hypothetical protein WCR58_06660 [Bacteroidales bacterium]|jgi:hypothetical protein|nr:hypothetical protein [Bacteroidales bacterium]MCK9449598.1 hypothetical protein [Bacteroidales bacterium]MDD3701965.1 hypothetical protein [Bacteroidales bacterium]MDY0368956.1 hypothetical protein [Bacteroidales bacterium]
MKTFSKLMIWLLLLGFLSCKKESNVSFHLDAINSDKYYSTEIIPTAYQKIYGKWRLYNVSGGIHGTGYDPDFDFLEIKSIGIYGLIRNDSLFEYGKIELHTFDNNTKDFLQLRLISDYYIGLNPYMQFPEKYIYLKGTDSLDLIAPCCDMYDYHYKRIK